MIYPMTAAGNIKPMRFVTPYTSADNQCLQASASSQKILGVSQRGTRRTPLAGLDDGYAAISGNNLQIYGPGETCTICLGASATRGARLASDSDGCGVTAVSGDEYGGILAQSGAAGDLVEMEVLPGKLP